MTMSSTRAVPSLLCSVLSVCLLQACRVTDYSERNADEVSADGLNFPASGFEEVDPEDLPQMAFKHTHLNLGRVVQGTKVDSSYSFTNVGGGPLVITDVRGSCGCTVGKDWPKQPVKPGERATIRISFDSEGRTGHQEKTVTVVANTSPPSNILTLTADVIGPEGQP